MHEVYRQGNERKAQVMDFAKRNAEAAEILARQLVRAKEDREELEVELWHEKALRGAWQEAARRVRNGTIEECARVVKDIAPEGMSQEIYFVLGQAIAAIRALKDKP